MSRSKASGRRPTMAERADRFALYQQAVQCPEFDVAFFARTFRAIRGRVAARFREDFCGTAELSCTWVRGHPRRRALGIDLDGPTLDYARSVVLARQSPSVRRRVELRQANVLDVVRPRADLTCALNFSYCVFKTRELLRRYFQQAHQGLRADGLLFLEIYGGMDTIRPLTERRRVGRATYIWQQEIFNPITNETLCHIHFAFPDGSRLRRAFSYDWRLWSIPELRECLLEAGFRRALVYWEGTDETGEPSGRYRLAESAENQQAWIAYVVGVK